MIAPSRGPNKNKAQLTLWTMHRSIDSHVKAWREGVYDCLPYDVLASLIAISLEGSRLFSVGLLGYFGLGIAGMLVYVLIY